MLGVRAGELLARRRPDPLAREREVARLIWLDREPERMQRANLPALEQALEERFVARAQAIKSGPARNRLLALLYRARAQAEYTPQAFRRKVLAFYGAVEQKLEEQPRVR